MAIIQMYDVTCNVCERDFDKLEGLPVDNLGIVQQGGWLVLFDGKGKNPHAAICPVCWAQIAECHSQANKDQ